LAPTEPIWLSEADVGGLIALPAAIECVERVLALDARGGAQSMQKTFAAWEGGTLHALGGSIAGSQLAGTKTWVHAGGAEPLLLLWDTKSGRLRGILEAFALGQLRTAAVSAVATRWLARADADTMAIIGTGKQALAQVAAVAAVRRLRQVRVFSPTADHRAAFVARLSAADFGFEVIEATSADNAVAGAAVVTTATRAPAPFVTFAMLDRGAHVNAIGAITPERCEIAPDVVARASRVVADHPADARRLSGELAACESIDSLSAVVDAARARPADEALTVFKAVGLGLADVAIAAEALGRAAAQGVGRPFASPQRAMPRWRDR
jgi:ornithine cyclodeaminase